MKYGFRLLPRFKWLISMVFLTSWALLPQAIGAAGTARANARFA